MYWQTKRRVVYALAIIVGLLVILVLVAYSFRDFLLPPPTCFDTKQNGYELGVDCGGVCSLKCTQEVNPLSVVWTKVIHTGKDVYDVAAMVANTNIDNASSKTDYTFTLYGINGEVISSLGGSFVAPLDSKFPLIAQNIPLKVAPSSVILTFSDGPHYKVMESQNSPVIRVVRQRYENGQIPRVYATIMNTGQREVRNLPVKVVLYDVQNNAYAVGQTFIPLLEKEGTKEVIITWGEQLPFAPSKIGIYPTINPTYRKGN